MPLNLFGKRGSKGVDYKSRLEHKLYLARENPEPLFDLSSCALKDVPGGIYSLCKVFRKEALYLQENNLNSLAGGGSLCDLTLLQVLDLSSNNFIQLPDDIGHLKNLRVLNVSNNQLKTLPESISNLGRLCVLNASVNNLKTIPNSCGNLKKLQMLDLRNNKRLKILPNTLAHATSIKELLIDREGFLHPPCEIVSQGTTSIMQFLANELGVKYESSADLMEEDKENEDVKSPYNFTNWEEKDNVFQAKILQLERLKDQKQQDLLALERELEKQQQKELELQNAMRSDKGKLIEGLVEQQNKLESEIMRIQQDREAERRKFIEQVLEVERTADSVVSQLMALSATRDSQYLQKLVEMEQEEEQRLLNIAQAEQQEYRYKDVINAMEALLEEECRHEQKLREYEEGRAEVTRTLLSQQVESDCQLEYIITTQGNAQDELVARLQKDMELQRAAVGALLERSDAHSWGLLHQVALVESQLATLTAVEMERRKLEMTEQVMELSEKRVALSALLLDLLAQQAERRQQLLDTLTKMEKHWSDEKADVKSSDFWLRQYQRLLDSRPSYLTEMERTLDPLLTQQLVLNGVIHCLPFLAKWVNSKEMLHSLDDTMLKDVGVTLHEDRESILRAIRLFLKESSAGINNINEQQQIPDTPSAGSGMQPSAPPPVDSDTEARGNEVIIAECVVCMEEKCEVIFVPCGHMCCCIKCVEMVTNCPMCRSDIEKKIRVILP